MLSMPITLDLTQKVQNLPPDASDAEVIEGASEVEALLNAGQIDESLASGLFILWAQKLAPVGDDHIAAREVITAARRGLTARSYAKKAQDAYAQVADSVRELVARGFSESAVARLTGVDRMTVRKALGKRGKRSEPEQLFVF
jgi:hypothetical protein